MIRKTLDHWLGGIRVYIGIGIVLATFEAWWWTQTSFGGSDLAIIRLQETYAWIALGLLLTAMFIGPIFVVNVN